jgi:hypothetical protein
MLFQVRRIGLRPGGIIMHGGGALSPPDEVRIDQYESIPRFQSGSLSALGMMRTLRSSAKRPLMNTEAPLVALDGQ